MLSADQLLAVLWRRRLTVVATFLAILLGAATMTFSLPDVYSTTSYLLVRSTPDTGSDFEASQVNQVLTRTYAELLQTRSLAEAVAEALPFSFEADMVQDAVKISALSQTQLIEVTAEASSPSRAQELADTYARVFVARSDSTASGAVGSRITVAEPAALVDTPVRPRPKLYLLVATVLAAAASAGAAALHERFDQRLTIDGSTTELLGLPVLARVSQQPSSRSMASAGTGNREREPPGQTDEAFRLLLANLAFVNLGPHPQSLAVVSPGESEGKSTCCVGIGRAAEELGMSVLLVDGDLRRPGLSTMLRSTAGDRSPGFSSLLVRGAPLAMDDVAVREPGSSLHLLPSGRLPPNPSALLAQQGLDDFDRRAKNLFDLIVYDTPPLAYAADASLLAAKARGTILVIDARNARRNHAVQAIEQLQRAHANVLGLVLNRMPASSRYSYYHHGTPQVDGPGPGLSNGDGRGSRTSRSTARVSDWLRRSRT